MSPEFLSALFGWMSVLNLGYLIFASLVLMTMRGWITGLQSRMFGIEPARAEAEIYRFIALYKLATLVFCVAPWLALQLI